MKILCLDGGGVFGKIQSRIVKESGCVSDFDAYAGTSIGSVLALGYALGIEEKVSPKFFDEYMPKVFKAGWFRKNLNFLVPKYSDNNLNHTLRNVFGSSAVLGDCKKPCFITAANIGTRTLKVFSSSDANDGVMKAWETCRCAVAAETYFSSYDGYMDGGIYANNPSMVAVAAAVRTLGAKLEDIELFSIGTGSTTYNVPEPKGRLTTALWVVKAMLDGSADTMHDYFVRSLPLKKYRRIQFTQEPQWTMDNPDDMCRAEIKWSSEIHSAADAIKEFCNG